MFEVEITQNNEPIKKTVYGFGKDENKAKEDVFYQLCEISKIPHDSIKIVRLIYVD